MNTENIFFVNKYITLKLEKNETIIYLGGERFKQCKYILLNIEKDYLNLINKVESIDDIAKYLDNSLESSKSPPKISPEIEFWAHCSNIQAWAENKYDSRLLHSNLAFPLLKKIADLGDTQAKVILKEEIAKRFSSLSPSVLRFLIKENYLDFFNKDEEIEILFEKVEFLDLSGLKLKKIPLYLSHAKNIKFLNISNNRISKLPPFLKDFKKIEIIDISHNNFTKFPSILENLRNLKELYLADNKIHNLKEKIRGFQNLRKLDLSKNNLKIFPNQIAKMKLLRYLDLSINKIEEIPYIFDSLKQLNHLDLANNVIKIIPETMSQHESLRFLNMANNQISNISSSIAKFPSLQSLIFFNNNIKSIPNSLKNLKKLESLDISFNPIENIPYFLNYLNELILDKNQTNLLPEDNKNLRVFSYEQNIPQK